MAFHGSLPLVGFAFAAGAFTFFAPCAYPLLPGYVAYYLGVSDGGASAGGDGGASADGEAVDGGGDAAADPSADGGTGTGCGVHADAGSSLASAVVVAVAASAGFFAVYGALAAVVAALGASLLADVSVLELVVGGVLVALGAAMAAGWTPRRSRVRLPERRRSLGGFFGFGVLYAAAAAGCTAPVFVAVALEALAAGPAHALAAFAAYAGGMSLLIVAVTVATALGRAAVVRRLSGRVGRLHRAAGVALVVAGLVQIYFFLFRFDGLQRLGLA
jgi:cytochrome c-type biogenesis protein